MLAVTLAVTLWLLGVLINWTFTSGGMDMRACLFVDCRRVNVFICMLNFCSWSEPQKCFNSEIFLIYGTLYTSILLSAYKNVHVVAPCVYHVPCAVDGPVFIVSLLLYSGPLSPGGVKLVEAQEKRPHLLAERGQDSLEKHNL